MTASGSLIRVPSASISTLGRYAKGVRLKRVKGKDVISGMFSLVVSDEDEQTADEQSP